MKLATTLVRTHYLYLSPLITLGILPEALLNQNLPVLVAVSLVGLAGTVLEEKRLTILASASLLVLVVWGKIAVDLSKARPPDTAVFLLEFGTVLFLMEASLSVSTFYSSRRDLEEKEDELSRALEARLRLWLEKQLSRQGKIAIGSIGLSVLLLPLAGFTSISSYQPPLTATLLLLALVALLFLVTHRREPVEG